MGRVSSVGSRSDVERRGLRKRSAGAIWDLAFRTPADGAMGELLVCRIWHAHLHIKYLRAQRMLSSSDSPGYARPIARLRSRSD